MCGRFTLRTSLSNLWQTFLPELGPEDFNLPLSASRDPHTPRYNIAPTQAVTVLRQAAVDGRREGVMMRWGLIPSWADDVAIGARMINARGETVDEKRSFRHAFERQRCLIPADGYFEWQKQAAVKQPFLIHRPDEAVFAMAGVWEINTQITPHADPILSCTLITTSANRVTGAIHDRMPVILDPSDFDRWLDPQERDTGALKGLLTAVPEDFLVTTPVSRHVNHVRNDDPECVRPVELKERPRQAIQTTMFDD
ncbi:MAG: SOS response-associated peptidase [Novipirellula sp. JB048]